VALSFRAFPFATTLIGTSTESSALGAYHSTSSCAPDGLQDMTQRASLLLFQNNFNSSLDAGSRRRAQAAPCKPLLATSVSAPSMPGVKIEADAFFLGDASCRPRLRCPPSPGASDPRPSPAYSRNPLTSSKLFTAPSSTSSSSSAPARPFPEDMNPSRVNHRRRNGLQDEFLSKLRIAQPVARSIVEHVPIHA
jgi:hypothetical protein